MKKQIKIQSLQQYKQKLPIPLKEYETTLIWSGSRCFNPVEKTGRRIFTNLQMEEVEYPFHLSSVDNTEKIDYKLYSVEPLMWSENDDLFTEVNTHIRKKNNPPVVEQDPDEKYRSMLEKFVKQMNI
jgi:hypothetical protein